MVAKVIVSRECLLIQWLLLAFFPDTNSQWKTRVGIHLFLSGHSASRQWYLAESPVFLHPGGILPLLFIELNCGRETQKESSKMLSCVEHNTRLQQTELDKIPAAGSTVSYCFKGKSSKIATNCLKYVPPIFLGVSVIFFFEIEKTLVIS